MCGTHERDELTSTGIVEENLVEQFSFGGGAFKSMSILTGSGLITPFEIIKPKVFISSTINVHFSNLKCKFASLHSEKTSRK